MTLQHTFSGRFYGAEWRAGIPPVAHGGAPGRQLCVGVCIHIGGVMCVGGPGESAGGGVMGGRPWLTGRRTMPVFVWPGATGREPGEQARR